MKFVIYPNLFIPYTLFVSTRGMTSTNDLLSEIHIPLSLSSPSPIYNQILEKTQFFFLETLNPLQKQSKK